VGRIKRLASRTRTRSAKGGPLFGGRQQLVKDTPQAESVEERPYGQDGSPSRGIDDLDGIRVFTRRHRRAEQGTLEFGQQRRKQFLAPQISDDALFDFAVVAVGFDDTDVLVDVAAGRRDFNDADLYDNEYHDVVSEYKQVIQEKMAKKVH
jgi:hypothetical protein